MHSLLPILFVFVGCCSNVVFLELIVSDVPTAGNIITFAQFLFIALDGFIRSSKFGTVKPKIPIKVYAVMVTLFFIVSVANNAAFSFDIPMPLHMIFRAGSLMASLMLGRLILKRRYPMYKVISVVMISLGITIATVASAGDMADPHKGGEDVTLNSLLYWIAGLALLLFALFMTAGMGIYQETVYKKHGKHPSEALFYNHALPLPGYLFLAKDIYRHVAIFSASDAVLLPLIGLGVPKMWLYLLANCVTQYVCIRSVFVLTTECTALTVTLIVTLRKFTSLVFSIYYFQNTFTLYHWLGAAFVFGGTLLFTDVFSRLRDLMHKKDEKVE